MALASQRLSALAALATIAGALTTACSKPQSLEAQLDAVAQHSHEEGEIDGDVMIACGEAADGAGSIYSTTRDLWRVARALKADRLLTRKSQDLMYRHMWPGNTDTAGS